MPLSAMGYLSLERSQIAGQAKLWLIFLFIFHLFYCFFFFYFFYFMPLTLSWWFPRKNKCLSLSVSVVNYNDSPDTLHRSQGIHTTWPVRSPSKYFQSMATRSDLGGHPSNLPYCLYLEYNCFHPAQRLSHSVGS